MFYFVFSGELAAWMCDLVVAVVTLALHIVLVDVAKR